METCLPLTVTHLVEPGILTWNQAIEKLTINPARILKLQKGHLGIGADADITIIDPTMRWTYDVNKSPSKSRNSPYHGAEFIGRATTVIVGGVVKYRL
ncbi:MAG: amidohydrolase family protein [Pirellulales bacterium]